MFTLPSQRNWLYTELFFFYLHIYKKIVNNMSDIIVKLSVIQMSVHLDSKWRTLPWLIHYKIQQLQFKNLQWREAKPALSDMSVSLSVWSLQFPTAWAYLLHLYEKLWGGEGWEPVWLYYICIQCLEAMHKEHLPLQPGCITSTNNLGEG